MTIDVERLARAIEALKGSHYRMPTDKKRDDVAWIPYLPTASKIAAEYERLAPVRESVGEEGPTSPYDERDGGHNER